MLSTVLEPGQHLVRSLTGRSGVLHVVSGEVRVADFVLTTGDAAHAHEERALSVTALGSCELLLCELG